LNTMAIKALINILCTKLVIYISFVYIESRHLKSGDDGSIRSQAPSGSWAATEASTSRPPLSVLTAAELVLPAPPGDVGGVVLRSTALERVA
jgi:hypothetical protein